ncbi:MAG TPA: saccharopine dehydrogenase NADP-binding domain-containing protein [Solirubrobacterales bacterium]|nr:saccharopine dehydrogenase NADP-binding domain-containing protein [Solirubrobacterales bacterium]
MVQDGAVDQLHGEAGPIAVYGATGFTGGLIARELRRLGADLLIAGRDARKLETLSEELGGVPFTPVSVDDPAGLRELLKPCSVVVACAGPFGLHGEPVVEAAVDTGTHYLDTTGEQGFMRMVFERYGERAAESGAALVSGMGFDYLPGDLIASLTAAEMGPLEEIVVAYCVHGFAPTHGTALSGLEIMRGGDVVWAGGDWRPAPRSANGGRWRFPDPLGELRMLRYPAGEQITVPRHVETARVRTLLNGMVVPPPLMPVATAASPLLGLAMRTPLRRAMGAAIRRLPAAPSEADRKKARFTISCEARGESGARRGTVRGGDVYGLTAVSLAHGALLCADPAHDRKGALAPAQAFDPTSFFAALADFGVSIEVEPLPTSADR